MSALPGLLIAAGLLGAIVWFAFQVARRPVDGAAPQRRPVWLGPDAVTMAAALGAELATLREEAGLAALLDSPATAELAAHHAFDMATRGYCIEEDPEGVDLGGRRHRLHPGYVGRLWELDLLFEPDAPYTEDSLLSALRRAPAWAEACDRVTSAEWNAAGVGVAVEQGRCALCIVLGAWWATVDQVRLGEAGVGGWQLDGQAAPDCPVEDLSGRLTERGDIVSAVPHDNPVMHPHAFSIVLPFEGDASGLTATVFRRGEPGLVRVLR